MFSVFIFFWFSIYDFVPLWFQIFNYVFRLTSEMYLRPFLFVLIGTSLLVVLCHYVDQYHLQFSIEFDLLVVKISWFKASFLVSKVALLCQRVTLLTSTNLTNIFTKLSHWLWCFPKEVECFQWKTTDSNLQWNHNGFFAIFASTTLDTCFCLYNNTKQVETW